MLHFADKQGPLLPGLMLPHLPILSLAFPALAYLDLQGHNCKGAGGRVCSLLCWLHTNIADLTGNTTLRCSRVSTHYLPMAQRTDSVLLPVSLPRWGNPNIHYITVDLNNKTFKNSLYPPSLSPFDKLAVDKPCSTGKKCKESLSAIDNPLFLINGVGSNKVKVREDCSSSCIQYRVFWIFFLMDPVLVFPPYCL